MLRRLSAQAVALAMIAAAAAAQPLPRAIDGDTIAMPNGERLRLFDVDAPELASPRCPAEASLARIARDRLAALIRDGFTIERLGRDRYRRTLARITLRDGRDVGAVLVAERLAMPINPARPARRAWCSP